MKKNSTSAAANLRQKAEELMKNKVSKSVNSLSEAEIKKLIYELELRQLELELQNDEIMLAVDDAITMADKYQELYDLVPMGYFTLSPEAIILELNLSGARMLGKDRSEVKNSLFGNCLSDESLVVFDKYLKKIFQCQEKLSCEVTINGPSAITVMLTGIRRENKQQCLITGLDITEDKEAEEKLQIAYDRIKRISDSNMIGLIITNADGAIIETNDYYANMLGYTPDDFTSGRVNWRSITPPEWLPADELAISQMKETGTCTPYEKEYFHKNGSRVVVQLTDALLYGTKEQIIALVVDITLRKQAENELQESEERFQLLFNKAPLGYQSLDFEGNFLEVNQQWIDTLGYTRDEVIGKWFGDFLSSAYQDGFRQRFPLFKAQGQIHSEFEMLHKNGSKLFIAFDGKIGYDAAGKFKQTHCILKDITQQKQAEEALQKSEERFRGLVETTADLIWETNMDGVYTYVSPQCEKILGYKQQEMLGHSPYDFMSANEAEKIKKRSDEIVDSNEPFEGLVNMNQHKNGETVIFETSGVPVFGANKILWGYRGIDRDITEHYRDEETLRQNARLLKESQEVARLGTYVWNIKTNLWDSSEIMDGIFGIDESYERTLEGWSHLIHPEHREMMMNHVVNEVLGEGKRFDKEYKILRPSDGEELWVHGQGVLEFDSDNKTPLRLIGTISDINERKLAEEKTISIGKYFQSLIENAPDGIVTINHEFGFSYVSPSARRMFAYPLEGEITDTPDELTHPDDLPYVLSELGKVIEDASYIPTIQYRMKFGENEWKWVESTFTNLFAEPAINSIVINFRDITEEKQAREELLVSENKYHTFIDTTPDCVFLKDKDFRHIVVNKTLCELYDKAENDIIGKTDFELMPHNYALNCQLSDKKAIETNSRIITEEDWDGVIYETYKFPVEYAKGLIGVGGYIKNITARKQAEKALRITAERHHSIVETSMDGYWVVDMQTHFLEVNQTYCHMSGYTEKELLSMNIADLEVIEDAEATAAHANMVLLKGVDRFESIHRRKDGSTFEVEVSVQYISAEGGRLVSFIKDITERKKSEIALRENQEVFSLFIKHSPIHTYIKEITETQNKVWMASDNFSNMIGVPVEQMSGKTMEELFPPEFAAKIKADDWDVVSQGKILTLEEELNGRSYTSIKFPIKLKDQILLAGYTIDLTDMKEAAEFIKISEERYRLLANHTTDMVWLMDLNLQTTYISPSIEKKRGFTLEEHQQLLLDQNLTPESAALAMEIFTTEMPKIMADPHYSFSRAIELEFNRKDGSTFWMECIFNVIRDEQGNPVSIVGEGRDITERRVIAEAQTFLMTCGYTNPEENFFESLARYLAESFSMDYVCIDKLMGDNLTAQTVAVYNDGKFEDNVTYTLKETPCGDVVGKTICCFPENVCNLFPHDAALHDLKAESYVGTTLWSFDGKPIGLIALIGRKSLTNTTLTGTVMKLVSIRAAAELERQQAEADMKEWNARFTKLSANAPGLIFQFTRRPDGSYHVPIASEGIKDIFGCTPEDVADSFDAIAKVLHPEDAQRVITEIEYSAQHLTYFTCEFRVLIPGRPIQWIYSNSSPEKLPDGSITWFGFNTNITLQKLIHEELKKSQERFSQVTESAGEWIWEVDSEGIYTFASPVIEKILGFTPDEIVGKKHFYELFYNNGDIAKKEALKLLASKQPLFEAQNQNLHKNGSVVWLSTTAVPIIDNEGNLLGYRGADTDITASKHAQEKLLESEEKYRTIFENVQDVFYQTTLDGIVIDISPSIKKFSGFEQNDLIGQEVSNLYYNKADRDMFIKGITKSGIVSDYELLLKTKDGQIRYASVNASLIFNKEGQPDHIDGALRDITARKTAEKAMSESEEKFAVAFKTSPYAIAISTVDDGEFIEVNNSFQILSGYTAEETIGKKSNEMNIWVDEKDRKRVIEQLRKGKKVEAMEMLFRKKNYEIITCIFSAQFVSINEINYILSSTSDISERKKSEKTITMLAHAIRSINECVSITDMDDKILFVNDAFLKTYKYEESEVIGNHISIIRSPNILPDQADNILPKTMNGHWQGEILNRRKDGDEFPVYLSTSVIHNEKSQPIALIGVASDISDRKLEESYREIRHNVLQVLNETGDFDESIHRVVSLLKQHTGIDVVGIRLQNGEDFPYVSHQGFPDEFLKSEDTLLSRDNLNGICRDAFGNARLECTCGLVISGKAYRDHPLFTYGGSFWTNESSVILDIKPEDEFRFNPRNVCIHMHYTSIALIPIRSSERIIGLIQLNDKRPNRFTLNTIHILENIASHIGTAMMRKQAEKALQAKMHEMQRFHELTVDRELKMVELKKEINTLLKELGQPIRYESVEN